MTTPRKPIGISFTRRGFTLIELMIVIAIMAIVMTMGLPAIYRIWHKETLPKTVREITDVLDNARSLAILQGNVTEVVFHARDGRFELVGGGGSSTRGNQEFSADFGAPPAATSGKSGQIPEEIGVAQLKVNGVSCMDFDSARVRFYPNGTCDELRLVLLRPDNGDSRGIFLEVTTGLVDTESDPGKLAMEVK
jgi:prepilin-type N-terminal cleavage/methylation domain-containing protein